MLYALIVSRGSWDDYASWTVGIFDDPFLADEAKRKLIAQINEKLKKYSEEEIKRLDEEFGELESFEDLKGEVQEYYDWTREDWRKYNIDAFHVEEFELNKIKELS